jgi:ABC-type polar amino acid transport system ATPase subunit
VLKVTGLGKSFGARALFDGLGFTVAPGESVAVMGESGTGKSTLLRCIDGFEQADAGTVEVGDIELDHRLPPARFRAGVLALRRRVGFVFQGWHLFAHRRVLDNVMEGPVHVRRMAPAAARARAQALLDEVGVGHRGQAFPHELSGGEQQRAAIARALAMDPEVLLLDEPTSALDEARVARLAELLRSLVRGGLALVTVSHDAAFARAVADRRYRLEGGRLIEDAG